MKVTIKKNKLCLCVSVVLFLVSTLASALPANDRLPRTTLSRVSVTYQNFEYQEPDLMEESGSLYGLQGRIFNRQGEWSTGLEGEVILGELTYDGQTQTGTPLSARTEDRIYKGKLFIGPNVRGDDWITTLYAGVGYRYWFDDIKTDAGYRREISYLYYPLGFYMTPTDGNYMLNIQYNNFGSGNVTSHLGDVLQCSSGSVTVAPPGTPAKKSLNEGEGLSMAFEFYPDNVWSMETYFRSWDIEESNTARVDRDCDGFRETAFVEPANETKVIGFSLGRSF